LVLHFVIPDDASALEIIPITSASISPISGLAIGGTFSAPPDFVFNGFLADNPNNNFPSCLSAGCAPGSLIGGGGASGAGGDFFATISHAGQTIPACAAGGFGFPCFGGSGSFIFGPAVLPPFQGDPTLRVGGTFSIFMDISVFSSPTPPTVILHEQFSGTGSTVYDIVWQPQTETWQLVHTEGRIPPGIPEVPEPSTLALFGSTAAALTGSLWRRHAQRGHGRGVR
jgi:hypothetical protein